MDGAGPSCSAPSHSEGGVMNLPWDAAGLGDLDFAEHLLVFAEDNPEAAAAKLEAEKAEAARLQQEALDYDQKASSMYDKPGPGAQARNKRPMSEISPAGDVKDETGQTSEFAVNKACREKARRCRLNDRFTELASLLEEPSHAPRTDKASILQAAITSVTNLRREIGQLRQLNKYLEDRVGQYEKERGMHMYQQVVSYGHQTGAGHSSMVQPGPPSTPIPPSQPQTVYQIVQPAGAPPPQTPYGAVSMGGHAQSIPAHVHHHHMQQHQHLQPQPPGGNSYPIKHQLVMVPHSMGAQTYSMVPQSSHDASQDASLRPPVA